MSSTAVRYPLAASHHPGADLYSMQPYSRLVAPIHPPASPSIGLESFPPAGLFDDDEPLPLWADSDAGGSYPNSFDSASTGNTTPDSPAMSAFHLPSLASSPSSSSQPSSPAPSSPSSTALATPAPAPSKRKRPRLAGATKEQRLALAVIRHREIDGARRQREKEVVQRLERLTTGAGQADERKEDGDDTAADKRGGSRRHKREKVDVLEESAETIEQLRAAMKRMEEASMAQDAQILKLRAHLFGLERGRGDFAELTGMASRSAPGGGQQTGVSASHPLALLPSATSNALSLYDGRQSLMCSSLISSGPCLLLVQQGTGALLEANERFVSLSGYALSALLFTVMRAPMAGMHVRVCPLMLKHSKARGSPSDHTFVAQYASSRQGVIDLCSGKERRVDLLWRQYMASGRLYEVQYTAFVTRQGVMVWLCNLEDAVLVDEWDEDAAVGRNGEKIVHCNELSLQMRKQYASVTSKWTCDGVEDDNAC